MKKNFPLSGEEHVFSAGQKIVSTTDLKGVITHINDVFCNISGFSADELLGKSHNIVRHPEMPPAAFQNLWDTLKAGKPWMGIVNNRCKNGDNYWVDAYVTPILDGDTVTGYQSVRVKPERSWVERAEALYRGINEGVPWWKRLLGGLRLKLTGKLVMSTVITLLVMLMTGLVTGVEAGLPLLTMLAAGLMTSVVSAHLVARPWKQAAADARAVLDNDIALAVYTGRSDELGQMQLALHALESHLRTVVVRIDDAAGNVGKVAEGAAAIVDQTDSGVRQQQSEIDQVASAMHEMTATVQEIARNAADTAAATKEADREAESMSGIVDSVANRIKSLAAEVHAGAAVVRRLETDSAEIGNVVDVIRSIAEQTNLLALNAAIEAARAGESGRGFAVVADEVRTLATRTQESTQEIQLVVERLQAAAQEAAGVMEKGEGTAKESVDEVDATRDSLHTINGTMTRISDMSVQIATASEEQSAVAEEINRNVVNISQVADDTASASRDNRQSTEALSGLVRDMQSMVKQFGV